MRILILNSEYPPIGGGAGNASAHIAAHLEKMGHAVTVVTARFGALPDQETKGGVIVHRVPALRRRQDRSNPLEQLAFILSASLKTIHLASSSKPDVTLAFFGVPSGAVAWLLKTFYRIPYIVSLRGGDVPGFRPYDFRVYHRLIAPFLRKIWKNAVVIVANSNIATDFVNWQALLILALIFRSFPTAWTWKPTG
jgi:glycosyltransferase involved in cell wall biosynthesis